MADTNSDLQDLHDTLIAVVSKLSDAMGDAADAATVKAIATEMGEVNHRVTLVGGLLFAQQAAKISAAVQKVKDATADVQKSIGQISTATDAIKTVSSFLVVVDKAIDVAKLVAAA